MYNIHSIIIVGILFVLIIAANELGYRIGRHYQNRSNNDTKSLTSSIQAGILGLLALLLGFTFNMALGRFDNRSQAVILEANTIGTALLRTRLLPKPYDSVSTKLIQQYIDLRILAGHVDLTHATERVALGRRTDSVQHQIWDNAILAAKKDPNPVTTGYFIAALNDMIDARGARNAYLQLHVPEVILFLLFVVFITSGALMGYSSGLSLNRTLIPSLLMTFLITLVVFIIIDLDRPKRGLIRVNQESIMELKAAE